MSGRSWAGQKAFALLAMLILIVPAGTKHSYIRLRSSPGKRRKWETGWLESSLLLPVGHAECTDGEPERLYARLSSDCLLLWHRAPFARILVASAAGPKAHFSRLALLDPARLVRSDEQTVVDETLTCTHPRSGRRRLAYCVSLSGQKAILENIGGVGRVVCDTGGHLNINEAGGVQRRNPR